MRYAVIIEKAATNYAAYVPDLPGCVTTGHTVLAVKALIQEAINFHLERMRQVGKPIPTDNTL